MFRKLVFPTVLVFALSVEASSAGVFQDVFRGLDLLATPSGAPVLQTGDGTRVNGQRTGRLRILPDQVGNGYSLEFDRSFGVDSQGRPEVLDLGPIDLQLAGNTQMTLGYTNRGFLIGNANIAAQNLGYIFRGRTGAQNIQVQGTFALTNNIEINQFGFYSATLVANNNNSQVTIDGVLAEDNQNLDWDIGPISVQGNLFVDLFAGLLSNFGIDTSAISNAFSDSPIDRITQAIQDQILPGDLVAGTSVANELAASGVVDSLTVLSATATPAGVQVPEPTTIGMVLVGGLLVFRRR